MMPPSEEEKQIQDAINKLQNQINEQKLLVQKMIRMKQNRIQNEKQRLTHLKSLVSQQNSIEERTKKETEHREKQKQTQQHLDRDNQQHGDTTNTAPTVATGNKVQKVQHNKTITSHLQLDRCPVTNSFSNSIIQKRAQYYYENRYFFNGYKFLHVNTQFILASTNHEITGALLKSAEALPLYITFKDKTYIKTPCGDYQLENCNKILSRQSKYNTPCIYYTKSGNCNKPNCRFQHLPGRIALCPTLQSSRHKCLNKICHYSHDPSQHNSPSCKFFQTNECNNDNCMFTHKLENDQSPICRQFAYLGYCSEGIRCKFTHDFQCPDLKEYGRCMRGLKCTCLHNSKMLESQQKAEDLRNKDNEKVIQIIYDRNSDIDLDSNESDTDSDSDDNVEFIVGPAGNELNNNKDYVEL